MSDDNIPTLTRVITRSDDATPMLPAADRAAIREKLQDAAVTLVRGAVEDVAVDIDSLLTERVLKRLSEALPDMIDEILEQHLKARQAERND